ncbi:hypothetical protein HUA74_30265 [Myxococcus sp. CA051A]|uniref:hypothetical protein n=1 Tax=Myxococcus sp. CA051A TaxID=2741739 RepID=UPI00157B94DD|nr:hypothetical protein [Myxococcus sp. CA051A]NTX64947.1 hypothetical protein [Myxococcus sp. CA051A]
MTSPSPLVHLARCALLGTLLLLTACGDEEDPSPGDADDAGVQGRDAGRDGGMDAGGDAGTDAGPPIEVPSIPAQTVTLGGQTYVAYQRAGDTFRIVCQVPCPIEEPYIFARYEGFRAVKDDLLSLTGVDVVPKMTPVDIHLASDSVCGSPGNRAGAAFMNTTPEGPGPGSNVCLWELEASHVQPPSVPRPLTVENALARENQVLVAHEYAHVVFFLRHELSHEWFVRAISYRVGGEARSLCDATNELLAPTAWNLCQQHGLDYPHLAESVRRIDTLWSSGQGVEVLYPGVPLATSMYQYHRILDGLAGEDTFTGLTDAGELRPNQCGDSARFTPAGGIVSMYGGRVRWELPSGAVASELQVEPGSWRSGMVVPSGWSTFAGAHNYSFMPGEQPLQKPVRLTVRYEPSLMPAGASEASLTLYWKPDTSFAQEVPGAQVDAVTHTVSGSVSRLGRYIVAPR